MLEIEDLTVGYGAVTAVDGVSLTAEPGRITAVLGANGAGKTSLLRGVSGLVRPRGGRVVLGGEDVTRTPVELLARKGMAHVPEGRGVIAELTVEENLRLGGLARRRPGRTPPSRTPPGRTPPGRTPPGRTPQDVYTLFPALGDRRRAHADTLSGGERQMLALGRALMSAPSVLLLDEPSLGLAPRIVSQLFALVRRLVTDEGLAVVLVEQNAVSALSVADVGIVLNLGRVVARAPAPDLLTDDTLRHAYLGF